MPREIARIDSDDSIFDLPALNAAEVVIARTTLDRFIRAQAGAGEKAVAQMYARLAATLRHRDRPEAEERLAIQTYVEALKDVPMDVLRHAFDQIVRTKTFFPTICEILDQCGERRRREWLIMRLRMMIERSVPDSDEVPVYCSPEAAAAILDEFGLRTTPTKPKALHSGPPRYPTEADYRALREELGWNG